MGSRIHFFFRKMKMSVDAIKIHLWGKNRELPEVTMKAFEKLKEAVTKEGLVLSLNERRQEGGSKMIAS